MIFFRLLILSLRSPKSRHVEISSNKPPHRQASEEASLKYPSRSFTRKQPCWASGSRTLRGEMKMQHGLLDFIYVQNVSHKTSSFSSLSLSVIFQESWNNPIFASGTMNKQSCPENDVRD
jgi:hypothetical protein